MSGYICNHSSITMGDRKVPWKKNPKKAEIVNQWLMSGSKGFNQSTKYKVTCDGVARVGSTQLEKAWKKWIQGS